MPDLVPSARNDAFIQNKAYTLADYRGRFKNPLQEKFITDLYQNNQTILKDLPIVTNTALSLSGQRLTNAGLDRMHWRRINDLPAAYKSTFTDYEEQMYLTRDVIQIDRALKDAPNWAGDPISDQYAAYQASQTYEINDAFINGTPYDKVYDTLSDGSVGLVDQPRIVGLKYRLDHPATYSTLAANKLNAADYGATLSGSQSKAQAQKGLIIFNRALQRLKSPDGSDVVCYGNDDSILFFENMIRTLGDGAGLRITDDAFDRTVNMFKNVKIRSLGTEQDGVTPIIPSNENADGTYQYNADGTRNITAANAFTSLYFVRYGTNGVRGWQPCEMNPENLGLSRENGVFWNVLMYWGLGLIIPSQFSVARIFGLSVTG